MPFENLTLREALAAEALLQKARIFLHAGAVPHNSLAMDSQPGFVTSPNAGLPSALTTYINPRVIDAVLAVLAAEKFGSVVRHGSWTDSTVAFSLVEPTGIVAAYGDHSAAGQADIQTNFPMRNPAGAQAIIRVGDREAELGGTAKLDVVGRKQMAAITALRQWLNLVFFKGVAGKENYGLLNAPGAPAALTPSTKVAGGTEWFVGGVPNATALEVYNDIVAVISATLYRSQGNVTADSPMVLGLPPLLVGALSFVTVYGKSVKAMLAETYPNLTFAPAPQYGILDAGNPQGIAAGNAIQLIVSEINGLPTVELSVQDALRTFAPVRTHSGFEQKFSCFTGGTMIYYLFATQIMIGL